MINQTTPQIYTPYNTLSISLLQKVTGLAHKRLLKVGVIHIISCHNLRHFIV